jgi:U2-associated protein SR140
MMRHRASSRPDNNIDDESSDEEDAFTALSRKRKGDAKSKESKKDRTESPNATVATTTGSKVDAVVAVPIDDKPPPVVVMAQTSSTKRHHGEVSDARKAKLDAILLELEAETSKISSDSTISHPRSRRNNNSNNSSSNCGGGNSSSNIHSRNIHVTDPNQRTGGSFVDPGDELITTNIFVGNLAPNVTEEQMTELFRQFGEKFVLM